MLSVLKEFGSRTPIMALLIKNERRRDMLVDELQYIYLNHSENKSSTIIYWDCFQRKQKKCKARLHSMSLLDDVEHNHSAIKDVVEVKSTQVTLKANATASHQSSRVLASQATANLDEATLFQLHSLSTLRRNVRKWRQKNANLPALPISRTGYAIPQEFTFLETGEKILFQIKVEFSKQSFFLYL